MVVTFYKFHQWQMPRLLALNKKFNRLNIQNALARGIVISSLHTLSICCLYYQLLLGHPLILWIMNHEIIKNITISFIVLRK